MHQFTFRSLALSLITSSILGTTSTQAQVFQEGQSAVSLGYGAVTFIGAIAEAFDTYNDVEISNLGPLYVKYEYGLTEKIGLGLNFAYTTNQWTYRYESTDSNGASVSYTESTDRTAYSVLARMNAHFGNEEKFDPYVGFGLGLRGGNWTTSSSDPSGTSGVTLKTFVPLGIELTIGARYFFTDNIGLYAELGAAKSVVQGGLAVKF